MSLIVLVAIIGLVTASTLKLGALLQRARAEQELLRIGAEFSDALQSYADVTPAGKPAQPATLQDLLRDPRFPTVRRHLRKIYVDPMTGNAEWGIVYLADKVGVVGIYSLSDAKPIKIGNFPARYKAFDGRQHISDWKFTMTGKQAVMSAPETSNHGGTVAPLQQNNSLVPPAVPVALPGNEISPVSTPVLALPPSDEGGESPPEVPVESLPNSNEKRREID
ncbi:MAG: hypothetical protein ACEQSK_09605 [Sphingomonadaceae bacterium]